jgi:hypothetical protein
VLYLVPLAGAWRKVTNLNVQARLGVPSFSVQ